MTEEVEVQEPTTEADFAFEYARERKMRMALETRMLAIIHEAVPFLQVTERLITAVIDVDSENIVAHIKQLTAWRAELEINLRLNTVWTAGFMTTAAEETRKEWDSLAEHYNLMSVEAASYRDCDELLRTVKGKMQTNG